MKIKVDREIEFAKAGMREAVSHQNSSLLLLLTVLVGVMTFVIPNDKTELLVLIPIAVFLIGRQRNYMKEAVIRREAYCKVMLENEVDANGKITRDTGYYWETFNQNTQKELKTKEKNWMREILQILFTALDKVAEICHFDKELHTILFASLACFLFTYPRQVFYPKGDDIPTGSVNWTTENWWMAGFITLVYVAVIIYCWCKKISTDSRRVEVERVYKTKRNELEPLDYV